MVEAGESLVGGRELRSQSFEFGKSFSTDFGIESLDRVLNDRDFVAAIEKSFGREADAVFRHDAENEDFCIGIEVFEHLLGVVRF